MSTVSLHSSPQGVTLGIVGLGLVGRALASRLKLAGYTCNGFDVNPDAIANFAALGHATSSSVSELASQVSILVLTVFDTAGVLQVVEELLSCKVPESHFTLMDCSTGEPEQLEALSKRLKPLGIDYIEAPLSGSSLQIEKGEATMLLGGDAMVIAALQPLLSAMASAQIHVGPAGMAARAKLATNLVLGLNRTALAEGMVFAESLGIAPATFLELVLATPASSEAAKVKGAMMVSENFAPQSRIRQHLKDVHIMLAMAKDAQQDLPLSQTHAKLMQNAIQAGDGELDNAAIIQQIRREKLKS